MKTKIVYVVASLDADIYMEQAIVSAWSVRYYNPGCCIEIACDQDTSATLDSGIRAQYKSLFDQIHVQEFLPEQSMMERSRWMKTTLREIVDGDYLYLDTDTVVCADLSYIDDFICDLGMALDQNCEFSVFLYRNGVINRTKRLYNVDISNEPSYFNTGVSYVKDTVHTHEFYSSWHELWKSKRYENEGLKDQSALAATNKKHNHLITEITGDLNCQMMSSIQYLHTAKVMHFFNTLFTANGPSLSPFYGKTLFLEVKEKGITEDIAYTILHCKSSFTSPSMPVPYEGAKVWQSYLANKSDTNLFETNVLKTIKHIHLSYPKVFLMMEKITTAIVCFRNRCKRQYQRV